jgi:hypothetical protein
VATEDHTGFTSVPIPGVEMTKVRVAMSSFGLATPEPVERHGTWLAA